MPDPASQKWTPRRRKLDLREPNLSSDPPPNALRAPYIRYTIAMLLVPIALIYSFYTYRAAVVVAKELLLRSVGVPFDADVTKWDSSIGETYSMYEVNYSFQLPNDSKRYTFLDGVRRDNRAIIDESDWLASKESKTLRILYLRSNPHVNRPANYIETELEYSVRQLIFNILYNGVPIGFIILLLLSTRRLPTR